MNRIVITILLAVFHLFAFSQGKEKTIKTKIKDVTVFLKGAEINRELNTKLVKGKNIIKLERFSPYILKSSIKIKGGAFYEILSMDFEKTTFDEIENSKELKELTLKEEKMVASIEDLQIQNKILAEKEEFLKTNQKIVGAEKGGDIAQYQKLTEYYIQQIQDIKLSTLKNNRSIDKLETKLSKVKDKISDLDLNEELPVGEMRIVVDAKTEVFAKMKISYFINKASWKPTYNFSFENLDKPLKILYKANIKQNTGVDWENVNIKLSNSNPILDKKLKDLATYFLDYNLSYLKSDEERLLESLQGRAAGVQVSSNSGELSGTVRVRGTNSIDAGNNPLYIVDGVAVNSNYSDPTKNINPDDVKDIQILKGSAASALYGSQAANGVILITTKKGVAASEFQPNMIKAITNVSNVEYKLKSPYTVLSDEEQITVQMKEEKINVDYQYKTIPKQQTKAFLIANISDWEKLNLVNGKVNLYDNKTFVGETFIDFQKVSDTLEISLNSDKNIIVKRTLLDKFNSNQFIGSKKSVTRTWKIEIKNKKNKEIKLDILDQVPISTDKSIDVEVLEISKANHNTVNGELKWKIKLAPKESKEFIISYKVKYPKNKRLIIK